MRTILISLPGEAGALPTLVSLCHMRKPQLPWSAMALCSMLASVQAQDLADVFARVSTSVVTIQAVELRAHGDVKPQIDAESRIGSGVLLDKEGVVLTAAHVVNSADEVSVLFSDGTKRQAVVLSAEPAADLALLRVQGQLPDGATACVLGDSDTMRTGNQVFAVGAPLGMDHTMTAGYVSARRREERFLGSMRFFEHLQTDVAINPGNSGGPLVNLRGEVVGIICHVVTSSIGAEGLGFAVTSRAVREILLENRKIWLGFDALALTEPLSIALNVPDRQTGFLVQRVAKASLSHNAGLRAGTISARIGGRDLLLGGDIILSILGHPLVSATEMNEAMKAVRELSAGSVLRLSVLREGKMVELSVKIGE